jgi:hypothetical protein
MFQLFGKFENELEKSKEFLCLEFSLDSSTLKQKWRNNGLSADFMADYFATFFPGGTTQDEIKSMVSFVANELLENTMKYGDETSSIPARISLYLMQNKLLFVTQNSVRMNDIQRFQKLIVEILASDPNELYVQRLEENALAENENEGVSGLGILTIINDYGAEFGWKFETTNQQDSPEVHLVTTMVHLNTQ